MKPAALFLALACLVGCAGEGDDPPPASDATATETQPANDAPVICGAEPDCPAGDPLIGPFFQSQRCDGRVCSKSCVHLGCVMRAVPAATSGLPAPTDIYCPINDNGTVGMDCG